MGNTADIIVEALRTYPESMNAANNIGSERDIRILYVDSSKMVVEKEK